jgi:hypothetical protein
MLLADVHSGAPGLRGRIFLIRLPLALRERGYDFGGWRSVRGTVGVDSMCDYSLERVASRPAVTADRLITAAFPNTITRGFAGIGDPNTAVCLRPGTELAFDTPVRYQSHGWLWPRTATAKGTVARFRQIQPEIRHTHHDALEFPDGSVLFLDSLIPGQAATVLQLPTDASTQAKVHDAKKDEMSVVLVQ